MLKKGILAGLFLLLCVGLGSANDGINQLTDQEKAEGFVLWFDGQSIDKTIWCGAVDSYVVKDGIITAGGHLRTIEKYDNYIFKVDFRLPKAGNNGIGIRSGAEGSPGRTGMEIQILDDPAYKGHHPTTMSASIYGVIGPKECYLNPQGEWNTLEIIADGSHITTKLNGHVAVDVDTDTITEFPMEHTPRKLAPNVHSKSGYLFFCGHNSPVEFRNVKFKKL